MKSITSTIIFFLFSICLIQAQTVFSSENMIGESETNGIISIVDADLDGDDKVDVLVSSRYNNTVSWYKNIGNGRMGKNSVITSNAEDVKESIAADLDGDGDLDVVSASRGDRKLAWYQNDGNGNFSEEKIIVTDLLFVHDILAEDLDNDGDIDILSTTQDESRIAWYPNDGNGNFGIRQTIDAFGEYARSISTIDIEKDGDLDIVAVKPIGNKLVYYLNNGDGTFEFQSYIDTVTFTPVKVEVYDLDRDFFDDLVVSDISYNINFYENNRQGGFKPKEVLLQQDKLKNFELAHLDNDNRIDILAITGNQNNNLIWFRGFNNENFGNPVLVDSTINSTAMSLGDYNDDGLADLMAAYNSNTLVSYLNEGFGILRMEESVSNLVIETTSITADDLDGDGKQDIIVASGKDKEIAWFKNEGGANFANLSSVAKGIDGAASVSLADINNDGHKDILAAASYDSEILWLENDGALNFNEVARRYMQNVKEVVAADIDNDGKVEVVACEPFGDVITGIYWYDINEDGSFSNPNFLTNQYYSYQDLKLIDIDKDNDIDVIASIGYNSGRIIWFENEGNGSFSAEKEIIATSSGANEIFLDDLNEDGHIDIAAALSASNEIAWYPNDGNISFTEEKIISEDALNAKSVFIADFDNDGDNDVVSASSGDDKIAWYENLGNGEFNTQQVLSVNVKKANTVVASDFDEDGDMDIAAGSFANGDVVWFENLLEEQNSSIAGKIYWDKDSNRVFNEGDIPFRGIEIIEQPDNKITYTDSDGDFLISVISPETHSITFEVPFRFDCLGIVDFELDGIEIPFNFDFVAANTQQQDFAFKGLENTCQQISGRVFQDDNEDGVENNDEVGIGRFSVLIEPYGRIFTSSLGNYATNVPANNQYNININYENNETFECFYEYYNFNQTFPSNNEGYQVEISNQDESDKNFGIKPLPNNASLGIYIFDVTNGTQAGSQFKAWLDFKSLYITDETCTLRINHDPLLSLVSTDIPTTSQGSDYVEWIFEDGSAPIFYCNEMEWFLDSSAVANDSLQWEATYTLSSGEDICPENNIIKRSVAIESGPLRLSDASATLRSMRPSGAMPEVISKDEVLSYVINFKNPLQTTAYDVLIVDQLPSELDLASITKPFSSFSDFDIRIRENREMIIELNDINLSDASVNELNSYGFIQFNVGLKDDLPDGTLISNKATVYFNGIEASETNTITHRLDNSVNVINETSRGLSASIFPNPTSGSAIFVFDQELPFSINLKMYDLLGQNVRNYNSISSKSTTIERGNLTPGVYYLNIVGEQEKILGNYTLIFK